MGWVGGRGSAEGGRASVPILLDILPVMPHKMVGSNAHRNKAVCNRSPLTTPPLWLRLSLLGPQPPPPPPPPQASAFVLFPTIHAACEVVMALRAAGRLPSAVELCDYASLRCVHTSGSGTGWE